MAEKINIKGPCKIVTDPNSNMRIENIIDMYSNNELLDEITIPSNWETQGLNNYNGTIWYIIELHDKEFSGKTIIEFSGVDYFTDVYLNGKMVGSHEGYFQRFYFDITDFLKEEDNLLVVRVTSPREDTEVHWPHRKQLIKGIFNHHDCRPGGWNPDYGQDKNTGGIWNDIAILANIDYYISNVEIKPVLNLGENIADVEFNIFLESYSSTKDDSVVHLMITDPNGNRIEKEIELSGMLSKDTYKANLTIGNPILWETWDLGEPSLYKADIKIDSSNEVTASFGIREIFLDDNQTFYINGKRLFLRGTNIIPTQFLSELTEKRISAIVALLRECNINIVRVHAHVNRQKFYSALDNAGILVWQDFPLQWTYDESETFRDNAIQQISEMVHQYYNHPSIAFWCCHNEPGDQIQTLDGFLEDAVKGIDQTRIIRKASNYEEHPYDGWYWGNREHFVSTPMGPLVTEFGAQAIPERNSLLKFMSSEEIDKPDWDKWTYHNFQYEQTFNVAEIDFGKNADEFIYNSQIYQAELIKRAVNFYRRKRFNGITGIFQFMFVDCWPSITWSIVDYYLNEKSGYTALKKAYSPILLSVEMRQEKYHPGKDLQVDLWVINDSYKTYSDLEVRIVLDGDVLYKRKDIPASSDSIYFIDYKTVNAELPDSLNYDNYELEFQLVENEKIICSIKETMKVVEKITSWR